MTGETCGVDHQAPTALSPAGPEQAAAMSSTGLVDLKDLLGPLPDGEPSEAEAAIRAAEARAFVRGHALAFAATQSLDRSEVEAYADWYVADYGSSPAGERPDHSVAFANFVAERDHERETAAKAPSASDRLSIDLVSGDVVLFETDSGAFYELSVQEGYTGEPMLFATARRSGTEYQLPLGAVSLSSGKLRSNLAGHLKNGYRAGLEIDGELIRGAVSAFTHNQRTRETNSTKVARTQSPAEHSEAKPVKHTCGGPVFGKKTPGCPRCDQLLAGAEPVQWAKRSWHGGAEQSRSIAAHFARGGPHVRGECGPVCTFGDW